MNDGTRKRQVNRASELLEKFRKNHRMVERVVFQHERDFPPNSKSFLQLAVFSQKVKKKKYQMKSFLMKAESK